MKKSISSLVIIFLATTISIAQDCKPKGSTKDKETGEKISYYGGNLSGQLKIKGIEFIPSVYLINDKNEEINYIQTLVNFGHIPQNDYSKNDDEWFEVGSMFEFTLENGERLVFRSTIAQFRHNYKYSYTAIQAAPLADEDLRKLLKNKIASFTIYPFLSNEVLPLSYDLRGKKAEKLAEQFNCFNKQGYKNTGKPANSRKAETYLKLADKYVKAKKYNKALENYQKSDEEYANPFSKAKIAIMNIFLDHHRPENFKALNGYLDNVKRLEGSQENLKSIEELVLILIEANPEILELEEVLLLVAE
ncbi:hypothetical protein BWZ20_10240 [Winogradskyella sp. J14-2]|uniref:hypothetical protein n=1 Tax=Winogradskyella sp. J14-2 TaxID=1936080 RepID=UPI0009726820|nr:hypothetical protein [Winogradskyella sp. J14-2]APY08658.1 hypothetical protein BWZ20_10240 [Winogradskyella sp. J14-2]